MTRIKSLRCTDATLIGPTTFLIHGWLNLWLWNEWIQRADCTRSFPEGISFIHILLQRLWGICLYICLSQYLGKIFKEKSLFQEEYYIVYEIIYFKILWHKQDGMCVELSLRYI